MERKNERSISIIPLPASIDLLRGTYRVKNEVQIGYNDSLVLPVANFLLTYLSEHGLDYTIKKINTSDTSQVDIFIDLEPNGNIKPEGYRLVISKALCKLEATTPAGVFYGIQSIRQLILQSPTGKIRIPAVIINDSPRFSWRGMHLDVSRHFMPKEFIKKYIDYLAFLKMNTFHWHLVDDQGWRIEIKQYPKLTEIGAWRDSTWAGHNPDGSEKYDRIRHGGFYTQEEIREIVNYAAERFINIIPEIEIPGHSQAAIASYPELGCTSDTIDVWTKWGISPYIYNLDESTFKFLFNVLDEVMELFPSQYIHIGGDEAVKEQWKRSKKINRLLQQLNLKDETGLQGYFTKRIDEYVRSKGRNIIGWDEILEGDIPKEAAVMSWRGTQGGIEAARAGHKVVMTPTDYCYFDYYQSKDTTEQLAIGGFIPVEKVYSYDPVPTELTAEESTYIMGVQGNVWTEYLDSPQKVEYMIFPRIFAMSEIQWTSKDRKDYSDFIRRLKNMEIFLQRNRINYAKHVFSDKQ